MELGERTLANGRLAAATSCGREFQLCSWFQFRFQFAQESVKCWRPRGGVASASLRESGAKWKRRREFVSSVQLSAAAAAGCTNKITKAAAAAAQREREREREPAGFCLRDLGGGAEVWPGERPERRLT